MLSPLKITKCLYCDVRPLPFRHAQSCLNSLTIILSYEFHTCSFIHASIACIQIPFIHDCIISLISNCTENVILNMSDSYRLPISLCSSGRSYQAIILPIFFQFPSILFKLSWYQWQRFYPVCLYPSKGNRQYFFSYVCRYPSKGNRQYFFSYVCLYLSKGNRQFYLSFVHLYQGNGNSQSFFPNDTYQLVPQSVYVHSLCICNCIMSIHIVIFISIAFSLFQLVKISVFNI